MLHLFLFFFFCLISLSSSSITFSSLCNSAFCKSLEKATLEVKKLSNEVDNGKIIPSFGLISENICKTALKDYITECSLPEDATEEDKKLFEKNSRQLTQLVDSPLYVLYLRQLAYIREKSLKEFSQSSSSTPSSPLILTQALEKFRKESEECRRYSGNWSTQKEEEIFKNCLIELAKKNRKIEETRLQAAQQNQQAMQYLQIQAQQIQAISQQANGQPTPWSMACSYRLPASPLGVSLNYQQGKGTLSVVCVPDESLGLLGSNGFVQGVTPGNIGLSFNVNM